MGDGPGAQPSEPTQWAIRWWGQATSTTTAAVTFFGSIPATGMLTSGKYKMASGPEALPLGLIQDLAGRSAASVTSITMGIATSFSLIPGRVKRTFGNWPTANGSRA